MIRAIVAMDDHRGIARDGLIPWKIQADLKHFRITTEGHDVIMGYHTYQRLTKPLRNRRNYVWCRKGTTLTDGFIPVHDLQEFLERADDLWVIGGEAMYQETLPVCDELHITFVQGYFHCDRFFPDYESQFVCRSRSAWDDSTPACSWSIWQRT